MTKEELLAIRAERLNIEKYKEAKLKWDSLMKPIDGFGDFEELICQIIAINGDIDIKKRVAMVFCSDNGIVNRGVSQCGKEMTEKVAVSLGKGISTINVLSKAAGADVLAIDVGIDCENTPSGVINKKIKRGTNDFLNTEAMTTYDTIAAINVGIEMVKYAKDKGYRIIATGEMGIGNTTSSTALLCALLKLDSDCLTGRGAGLNDNGLEIKRAVIKEAINKYNKEFEDDRERSLYLLSALGGFDIAALAGVFIGGAIYQIPIVIDGLIAATGAVVAKRLIEESKDYMIASHCSREGAMDYALKELGLKAYIHGNMALGEATGAVMLFPLLDVMAEYYKAGTSFSDCNTENYERFN